ncbi:pre-rRNA processing factor, putative [Babesia ovis]|uniref:Pre-rRNA processing factor, putative n=1 Tax=Babesia ovis TaxID=5869 RepID=A0A9W5WUA4_BABOV|nr:pre-rRNA processing factor, putative [Babesia ovis]
MEAEEDFPRSSEVVLEPLGEPRRRARLPGQNSRTLSFPSASTARRSVKAGSSSTRGQLPTIESLEAGSLLLGSVAVVASNGLSIHLPGGLTGFVRASDAVDIPDTEPQRPEPVIAGSINVGSHVVCSVLEVKRGFASLSMRPSVINRGLSLAGLTSGMLLPATVRSHEEYGILLSFHLPEQAGVRGFVRYDDDNSSKDGDSSVDDALSSSTSEPHDNKGDKNAKSGNKKNPKSKNASTPKALKKAPKSSLHNLPIHATVYVMVESVNAARNLVTCKWPWRYDCPVSLDYSMPLLCVRPGLLLVGEISDVHIPASSLSGTAESYANYGFDIKCLNGLTAIIPAVHSVASYSRLGSRASTEPAEDTSDDQPVKASTATSSKAKRQIANLDTLSHDALGMEDTVIARVLYVNHWQKTIFVSILSHVVKWKGPQGQPHRQVSNALKTFGKVMRSIPGHGVVFSLSRIRNEAQLASGTSPETLSFTDSDIGFCESSHLSDEVKTAGNSTGAARVSSSAQLALKFTSGSVHSVIELGFDFLTRFVRLNSRESLQNETLLSPFQLSGGTSVKGVITNVGPTGVNVRLSKLVQGKVPLEHLTDVPLSAVPDRFSVGTSLKLRVLRFDYAHNVLLLTAKRGLRKDPLPLTEFGHLSIGKEFCGYISRVPRPTGGERVSVCFYNDLHTTLDSYELAEAERLSLDLSHGSVVRVVVTRVDRRRHCFYVTLSPDKMASLKALASARSKRRRDERRAACKKAFTNYISSRKRRQTSS